MNIAHTDLKPGDRFRMTEVDEGYVSSLSVKTIFEGTVTRVGADTVFYGPDDYTYLTNNKNATWERLAPAEPKNLGTVVEFTAYDGETLKAVRTFAAEEFPFYVERYLIGFTWEEILEGDANPRVLHEGWDGK